MNFLLTFALAHANLCPTASIGQAPSSTSAIPELVGLAKSHTVKRGESLYRIARNHGVGTLELARANELASPSAKPGNKLVLPLIHVPPVSIPHGIVLNIPERAIYVFRDGSFVRRFAGAVGKPSSQTAMGSFTLRSKVVDPTWRPPRSMVLNEGVKDVPVPPGPLNPPGDRWMGWSKPGFGFHSTVSPRSIGRAASHGCVRLYPEGARGMFKVVTVGMPIHAVYRPALLGKRDGIYYLSVFPDIYGRGGSSVSGVKKLLEPYGILPLLDESRLRRIVSRQHSSPQRILGEDEIVEVNGVAVPSSIRPVKAGGIWMVPIRGIADALGIDVDPLDNQMVQLRKGVRTCDLLPGRKSAIIDGTEVPLIVAPASVEGSLLVPLKLLLKLSGATAEFEKGKTIRIRTADPSPP